MASRCIVHRFVVKDISAALVTCNKTPQFYSYLLGILLSFYGIKSTVLFLHHTHVCHKPSSLLACLVSLIIIDWPKSSRGQCPMVQFTYVLLTLCKMFMKFRTNIDYFSSCRNAPFTSLNLILEEFLKLKN